MCTSLSAYSLLRSSPPRSRSLWGPRATYNPFLEAQPALAGRIRERLDAPVKHVAAAVEHDLLDAGLDRPLGDQLADVGRRRLVGTRLELRLQLLVEARGRSHGPPGGIVDDLGIDVLRRPMHR